VDVAEPVIVLRGLFAVRASVWAWVVEASFRLAFDGGDGGAVVVRPRGLGLVSGVEVGPITRAEADFVRGHEVELRKIVRYCAQMPADPWLV
jgi:hypothetical protein